MKLVLAEIDYCCFIALFSLIQAIPLQDIVGNISSKSTNFSRSDVENVCLHENTVYLEGQNISTSNPCEMCTCDPPGISCSLSSCDLKPGCKAIHKANQCCPEYVCECERNGIIYGNGEKVEEPNPCKVCYCKGGEIKCALVTCYTRDDCVPGYVAGVCCPKYDHCPPLETIKNKSTTPDPALVIISDLKTELSPTVRYKSLAKTFPRDVSQSEVTESMSTSLEIIPSEETISSVLMTSEIPSSSEESTTIEPSTVVEPEENTTVMDVGYSTEEMNGTTTEEFSMETSAATAVYVEETEANGTTEAFEVTAEDDPAKEKPPTTVDDISDEIVAEASWSFPSRSTPSMDLTDSVTTTEMTTELGVSLEPFRSAISNYSTDEIMRTTTPEPEIMSTTLEMNSTTVGDYIINTSGLESISSSTAIPDAATTDTATERNTVKNIIKVIVPKTMKKDTDQVQKSEGPAPIVVMISADQIQFLKLAEEPPMYVENHDSGEPKVARDQKGVVIVPKTTPTTVEMIKVIDGTLYTDINATTEAAFAATDVNSTKYSFNNTDFILER